MAISKTTATTAGLAVSAAMGATSAIAGSGGITVLHGRGTGIRAYNFGSATANALKQHSTVSAAVVAGLTAAAGGPAVVTAAAVALPFVAAAAGIAAVGAGGYALFNWLSKN